MVTLDQSLAILVDGYLQAKGVMRYKKIWDDDYCQFSEEQLNVIEDLVLTDAITLNTIELLPNLKSLTIKSCDFTNVAAEIDLNSTPAVNTITDFSNISKLKKLEKLEIINDVNIVKLDITELKNLKELVLADDPNLKILLGLDKLKNLEKVVIYGTDIVSTFDLGEYIVNTIQTKTNLLDINMYQSLIRHDLDNAKKLSRLYDMGETNIEFAESIALFDYATLSPKLLEEMNQRYDMILQLYPLPENATDEEKVKYVYDFVCNFVKFDYQGLKERNHSINEYISNYREIPEFLKRKYSMIHTSYNALINKKANCEGIVNLMNFMLKNLHVKCFNVHCLDVKTNYNNLCNHAMIRTFQNNEWKYTDPTLAMTENEVDNYKYFMKNLEELLSLGRFRVNAFEYQKINNKGSKHV